jgi:hypothetical protein
MSIWSYKTNDDIKCVHIKWFLLCQKTIVTLFTAVIILTIVIISDVDSDKPALKQKT